MTKFIFILLYPIILFAENNFKIIDGDTIHLKGEKIRFQGIDAPEIKQNCTKDIATINCGLIAKKLLELKIGNNIPYCIVKGKDKYKRFLGECFINGESLSSFLVKEGYAFAYTKYSKKFIKDEKYAIKNKNGMWSMDFIFPWDFRKNKNN